jgi:transposase
MQAHSTNWVDTIKFLRKLREEEPSDKKIYLVSDNHRAHHKTEVAEVALGLNIEFVFLPAGTPEMNSIECLWGVIKRDFKSRLI